MKTSERIRDRIVMSAEPWPSKEDEEIVDEVSQLEANHARLLAVVRAVDECANDPIAVCAYPGHELDIALKRLENIREALAAVEDLL